MTAELDSGASIDTALTVLASQDRRRLLSDLWQNPPLSLQATPEIIDSGSGCDVGELRLKLLHVHLPRLADAGYVEYDHDTGLVTQGPNFADIEPLLDLIANHGDELPDGWL